MASAQVLPSSRKQELAEAGRRKLDQFRKQKAAERAKKASSNSRTQPVDVKIGQQRVTESDGTVTSMSNGPVRIFPESHQVSSNETSGKSLISGDEYDISSTNLAESDGSKLKTQKVDASGSGVAFDFSTAIKTTDSSNDSTLHNRPEGIPFSNINNQASQNYDSDSSTSSFYGLGNSVVSDGVPKVLPPLPRSAQMPTVSSLTESFSYSGGLTSSNADSLQHTTKTTGSMHEVAKNQEGSVEGKDSMGQKPSVSPSYLFSRKDNSTWPSESSGFDLETRSSSALYSAKNETNAGKSRPSFLDSLNISKATETKSQHSDVEKSLSTFGGSQLNGSGGLGSASLLNSSAKTDSNGPFSTIGASNNPFENFRSSLFPLADGATPGFPPPKQNEDFAALEQHIEDLTQEKFSLQRALEASRALAESLASENSSLTETYNQQRGIVNQLKDDMAKLQEQIQAHMVELESVRSECSNARLECNAADERAKILASEVISLEEKALRLRSNELKLERDLKNAQAEMSSYSKKISSLEKDRQDLQSTINALQEEKKVLQTMLRKASSSGKSVDLGKSPTSRKDASTSTEGLDSTAESSHQCESSLSNDTILPENGQLTLEGLSLSIPCDQMRMIQNIDTLVSELAMEKEELLQALSSELSQSAKLKELNKELSRKLEAQTQRLELLTAKSMAGDNISSAQQPDPHVIQEIAPYADEGDEVVERVLGWIMKLFPGGPSRRRTSKLL